MSLGFYHSFPRRARGEEALRKGLEILRSMLESGLLLVPEINEFAGETDYATGKLSEPVLAVQQRFCMTCLSTSELPEHSQKFGPFHLSFGLDEILRLGAVPVIYVHEAPDVPMTSIGTSMIHRLREVQDLLDDLASLE